MFDNSSMRSGVPEGITLDGACVACGHTSTVSVAAMVCTHCGGPLTLRRPSLNARTLPADPTVAGVWRYADWLPRVPRVSIGEPATPLVALGTPGMDVRLKLDGLLPTGSFKDRGSSVVAGWLRGSGVTDLVTDSSGNAGASLTAYATKAGLRCQVFMPAGTSEVKVRQVAILGGEVQIVDGDRASAGLAARRAASVTTPHVAHGKNPLFIEGVRTWAFETWEQLGRTAPAAVFLPVGAGTMIIGCYLGFRDLQDSGLISTMPRMFGVQSTVCSPLADAFDGAPPRTRGHDAAKPFAEGLAVTHPVRGTQVLDCIRRTHGSLIRVTDAQIRDALSALASRGVLAEPSGAVATAGLLSAPRIDIAHDGVVVSAVTGHGWKDLPSVETAVAAHGSVTRR